MLDGDWSSDVCSSDLSWVNDPVPLIEGWNLLGFSLVWGCSAVCVVAALLVLRRRDIT
jgi:hypothetical protein